MDFSATVSAGAKLGLRMTMTVAPIALIVFSFFWFRKKYTLTDEKVAEIAEKVKMRH